MKRSRSSRLVHVLAGYLVGFVSTPIPIQGRSGRKIKINVTVDPSQTGWNTYEESGDLWQ